MSKSLSPPKWPTRFLRWYCDPEQLEEIQGDAHELFYARIDKFGLNRAKRYYLWDIIRFLRMSNISKSKTQHSSIINTAMLLNYFKIGFRNLRKHRLFAFINIVGLAVSMTVGLIIISMVRDLLLFDNFHENKANIYRVISDVQYKGYNRPDAKATCTMPLADILENNHAAIKEVVRIRKYFGGEASTNNKVIPISGYYTDANFFKVFSFDILKGNKKTMLNDPFSIVLTQSTADKLFESNDPIGELINIGSYGEFKVTGIIANLPKNSHLQFEALTSYSSVKSLEQRDEIYNLSENWDSFYSGYVYLLLNNGYDLGNIKESLGHAAQLHYANNEKVNAGFRLQAINNIVPGEDLSQQIGPKFIYLPIFILLGLAFAILLSACFNYTNLSIARSLKRAKEVGVRKVVGGTKQQIFLQFIIETIIVSLIALLFALALFIYVRPHVLTTVPRASELMTLELDTTLLLVFIGFALFAGLLAGIFPAIYLSKMNPVKVLKSTASNQLLSGVSVRKALIVFQFVLSLIFILGVSIVHKQYRYSLNYDLGFNKENLLNVPLNNIDYSLFQNEFSKIHEVSQISYSNMIPGMGPTTATWVKTETMSDSVGSYYMSVSANYITNLKIELVAGANFPKDVSEMNDVSIVVNQTFLKSFKLPTPHDALGEVILVNSIPMKIIGVVKDFHYANLEDPIQSFFFRYRPDLFNYANVKIASSSIQETLYKMDDVWQNFESKHDFSAQFFDDQIEEAYGFYVNLLKIFGFVAFLAISIAALGLLGMAVYTVETKTKEIGIRKVMGATESALIYLLSKDFVKLLFVASVIASIIVYFLFEKLILAQFAYKASVGVMDILLGILAMMGLCLVIIISQTQRAAKTNPSDTLKVE